MCRLNRPSKEMWREKRETIEHYMLQQANCWIHGIHKLDFFSHHAVALFTVMQDSLCWLH